MASLSGAVCMCGRLPPALQQLCSDGGPQHRTRADDVVWPSRILPTGSDCAATLELIAACSLGMEDRVSTRQDSAGKTQRTLLESND